MNFSSFKLEVGKVSVATSNDGGHRPEFWAKSVTDRLLRISDGSDEAFRTAVYQVVLNGIKSAITSDRTTMSVALRRQGHDEMADKLKEL